jgi:hypothetical protein
MSEKAIFQPVLHHAEELGQSRPYDKTEAIGLFVAAIGAGLWTGLTVLAIGAGYYLYTEYSFWTAFFVLAVPAGVLLGSGYILVRGLHEQIDGLRSWREATSYAPPAPQLEAPQQGPPIVVKPYKGDPYVLGRGDEPLALPDGRQSGLRLNEPTIAAILKEVISHHDGLWSRKRLMSIRVQGKRITRTLYEDLTAKLANAGFLQERPIGGYKVPEDIRQYDDLVRYFPNLETGKAGRQAGRQEKGGDGANPPTGGGEIRNLAERRRQRFLECGCDISNYLERKGGGHG